MSSSGTAPGKIMGIKPQVIHTNGECAVENVDHAFKVPTYCSNGSNNGLSFICRHAIIFWTIDGNLLNGSLRKNFNAICIKMQRFLFKKLNFDMPSAKCQPLYLCLYVLMNWKGINVLSSLIIHRYKCTPFCVYSIFLSIAGTSQFLSERVQTPSMKHERKKAAGQLKTIGKVKLSNWKFLLFCVRSRLLVWIQSLLYILGLLIRT